MVCVPVRHGLNAFIHTADLHARSCSDLSSGLEMRFTATIDRVIRADDLNRLDTNAHSLVVSQLPSALNIAAELPILTIADLLEAD